MAFQPVAGGAEEWVVLPDDTAGDLSFSTREVTAVTLVSEVSYPDVSVDNTITPRCLAEGTLIATPDGARPVEALRSGDRLSTADRGNAEIVAVRGEARRCGLASPTGRGRSLSSPVRSGRGCRRALTVSRQHRILLAGPEVDRRTGAAAVWVPAKDLVGCPGIGYERLRTRVTWCHLRLAHHAVLVTGGAFTESLYPGALRGASDRTGRGRPALSAPEWCGARASELAATLVRCGHALMDADWTRAAGRSRASPPARSLAPGGRPCERV